jgi:linoleoyl-CoA desaturase
MGASTATDRPPRQLRSDHPLLRYSEEELQQIADAFDAIYDETRAQLGAEDAAYFRRLLLVQRSMLLGSRLLLVLGSGRRVPWVLGALGMAISRFIENLEVGHNVLHGQWDWMKDPDVQSATWDWDTVSTPQAWRHSHNVTHHKWANVLEYDKDLGFEMLRVDPDQPWEPGHLFQVVANLVMALGFEWAIAIHDLDLVAIRERRKDKDELRRELKELARHAGPQLLKDYVLWPALSGRRFKRTAAATAASDLLRNVALYSVIFVGHLPDQAHTFFEEEIEDESRGAWYVRQVLGTLNFDASPLGHIITGHLGHQLEHHLYPDLPSRRYRQIAPRVREVCERHGIPYVSGSFPKQWLMVQRTILRLSFPGGKPRPWRGVRGPA